MPTLARITQRRWSVLVAVMVLLLAVACTSLALTVTAHLDANDARQVAKREAVALNKVTDALRQQCAQQLAQQTSLRGLEQGDVDLQRGLIAADGRNQLITSEVRQARRVVYERKLHLDLAFLASPQAAPKVCAVFDQPLPIAFRAVG